MRCAVLALTLVMAVAGVILLALAEPTLAQAQTPGNSPRSLVNNFHPSTDFAILSTNILYGQGFTTGPDSYSLDGVSLGLVNIEAGGELAVSIHSKGGDGFPTFPALYTLTAPDPLEGSAKNHFLAPAGAVLEAGTDYVVVMDSSGRSIPIKTTPDTTERSGKAPGWSISNNGLFRSSAGRWQTVNDPRKIDVIGRITAYSPPGMVEGLRISPRRAGLNASWDRVPHAEGYLVQWKSGGQSFAADRSKTIWQPYTTTDFIGGLTRSTEYTVRVIATRRYGTIQGRPSHEKTATALSLQIRTMVTNQDGGSGQTVLSLNQPRAQGFVTGPDFYDLRNIGLFLGDVDNGESLAVAIHEAHSWDADYPADTALYQLTPSRSPVDGHNIFEAPPDASLGVDTKYFVVFETQGGVINFQHTRNPGQSGALEWSIDNGHKRRVQSGWVDAPFAASMQVMGTTWHYDRPGRIQFPPTVTPVPGGLALSWLPPRYADGYKLQWKSGAETFAAAQGREEILSAGEIGARGAALWEAVEHTVYGLLGNTEHTVRVMAFREAPGEGIATDEPSDEVTGTPLPLPPRIEVSGRFMGSVDSQDQICWDESQGVCGNWVTVYPQGDKNNPQVIFVAEDEWAPMGLWSDGATMWVGDQLHSSVHALDMGQLRRGVVRIERGRSFADELLNAAGTLHPGVVWGDADTLWVFDTLNAHFHAYDRATKTRIPDKSFPARLDSGQSVVAWGVWSDGTTMWISGPTTSLWRPGEGAHWPTLGGVFTVDLASGHIKKARGYADVQSSRGLWSDGVTMWVVSSGDGKLKAYDLRGGGRDADRDIDIGQILTPAAAWSDGQVIWVSDLDRRIASYCLTEPCGQVVPEPPGGDFAGDRTTEGRLEVGGSVTGRIAPSDDVDWFAVYLDGGAYTFALSGEPKSGGGGMDGDPLPDPVLLLGDFKGNEIRDTNVILMTLGDFVQSTSGIGDDNSGGVGNDALLEVEVREPHYYFAMVRSAGPDMGTGGYELSVRELDYCTADTATTCSVAVGGATSGDIGADGDTDWFSASLTGGRIYRIDVKGASSTDGGGNLDNAGLTLYDASGNAISGASNNQGGADNNARYIHRAQTAETIYIEARDDDGAGVGTYTVAVTDVTGQTISEPPGQDFSGNASSPGQLLFGGTLTGGIDPDGDQDAFRVNLTAGEVYQFVLKGLSTGDGPLPGPYLVLNSGSVAVASNDNVSPADVNARIIYTVPANQGGEHTIVASSLIGSGVGAYTLTLSEVTDDCGEGIGTTCTVGFGPHHAATGEIEVDGDTDWFRLTVVSGRIYRFGVKGDSSTNHGGTLANAGLTLYDASGTAIAGASNNEGGADNNARYIFRAQTAETIYIEARDDDGIGVGTYTVVVTDVSEQNVSEPVEQDFPHTGTKATGRVLVGGSVTGELPWRNDEDEFQVDLADSTIYQFDLKGSASGDGTLENPRLNLYTRSNIVDYLATDQTSSDTPRNAQITYFVPRGKNGAYRLRSFVGLSGALGTYTLTVAKAPDDCTSGTATTCSVAVGGSISGEIEADGDTDWFRASLTGGRTYRIDVKGDSPTDHGGTLKNAGLTLYDASGTAISGASTNEGGADNNARYSYRPTADETIYIEARDNNGVGKGTYTVALTELPDDCTADTGTACSVDVGDSTSGEIEGDGDSDWFRASLTQGRTYRIDVKGASSTDDGGTLVNAGLTLYDASGTAISGASNNEGGADNNARYIRRSDAAETMYIEARDDDGIGVGTYTVAVTDVTGQNISEPPGQDFSYEYATTPGRILIGGVVTGEIDVGNDLDAFRVDLTAGEEYQIDLKGLGTVDGTLSDPDLELWSDVNGYVTFNDNFSGSLNSRITYTPPTGRGGGHTIRSLASSGPGGTYTLSITQTSGTRGSTGDEEKSSGEQEEVEAPPAPQNLTATVNEAGSVILTWDDPQDASITGYRILRRNRDTSEIGVFTAINDDTGSAATRYVDDTVEPGTRYVYRIKAINPGGLSPRSRYARADTPAVEPKANSPATGQPAVTGTARVGETLTADTSGIEDADGLNDASFSYQWLAGGSDIQSATNSTYTLAADAQGKTIQVKVTFTDDAGNEETLTSAATAVVEARPNSPATGALTISGTAQVGETLAADASGIEDADGLDDATFGYQWRADDTDITGATDSNYTLAEAEEGKTVTVRVSFTDDAGNGETLTSEPTSEVAAAEPEQPPSKPRGLTGTAAHNEVSLTWTDPGDASITGYQILRRNRAVDAPGKFQVHVDDTGSAAASYIDRDVAPETRYVYRIKARNASGLSERSRNFNAATPPKPNHPATGLPTISGTAQVGETLAADASGIEDADGLVNATFSYQWVATDGGRDLDIEGATAATYTLLSIDKALRFMVRVSFTDDGGNEETLTSAETAAVAKQ